MWKNLARLLCLAVLLLGSLAFAQQPIPPLKQRVTDLTGTLTASQAADLDGRLAQFEARKGSQIAVLILPTTQPEAIEQYGIRLAEAWKPGRKGVNDGAILLVAKNDRALRIEVGYGLEGVLPDAIAKRIVSDIIVPHFRDGDFYGGIDAGVSQMIRVIDGEPLPPPKPPVSRAHQGSLESFIPIAFMLVLVVGGVMRAMFGRFFGAVAAGGVMALVAWFLVGVIATAVVAGIIGFFLTLVTGGMGRGGMWRSGGGLGGGLGGGGSWGGSGGGGGWSGGGGDFGGGGASGKW